MEKLETDDMQGLIVRGYGKLQFARFTLMKIENRAEAKKYLQYVSEIISGGGIESPKRYAIQIAFTSKGLKALKLPDSAYKTFSREFLEGMDEPFRAVILGDKNENDPGRWIWGGPDNDEVHLLLMQYAVDSDTLETEFNAQRSIFQRRGISIISQRETNWIDGDKEHFGFKDGISSPRIEGLGDPEDRTPPQHLFKPGEFILGYENEYKSFTPGPTVDSIDDPENILPSAKDNPDRKDLGKNGTYLVYRELNQHVLKFWKYLEENSKEPASGRIEAAIKLGAKMVGRWPGGEALVNSPDNDNSDPSKPSDNNFGYWDNDITGIKCPFGSHIRRTNPRDHLPVSHSKNDSTEMIRKHQLLRRGRLFGDPLVKGLKPEDILKCESDDENRGLHFICLVGDLSRQFEFVQNVWVQSANFGGLFNDGDPLIGSRQKQGELINDEFTCPSNNVRRKYKQIPQFTKLTGGSYFFMPGIKALKYIASIS